MTMDTHRCILGVLTVFSVFVCSYSHWKHDTADIPRPGKCPRHLYMFPSLFGCSVDQDCPGDHKCCSYRCGSVCVSPVFIKALCPDPKWSTKNCQSSCDSDDDCLGGRKCCETEDGYGCVAPKIVKPGFCGFPPFSPCGISCLDDSYCSDDEKCCPSFCGHFCKPPL